MSTVANQVELSKGVTAAWQAAANLALGDGAHIELAHLLRGICHVSLPRPGQPADLQVEVQKLQAFWQKLGFDAQTTVPGSAGARPGSDPALDGRKQRTVHRSPETRVVFEEASREALKRADGMLDLSLLFAVLLKSGKAILSPGSPLLDHATVWTVYCSSTNSGTGSGASAEAAAEVNNVQNAKSAPVAVAEPNAKASARLAVEESAGPDNAEHAVLFAQLDAHSSVQPNPGGAFLAERLTALSEAAWELGTDTPIEMLLQKITEELLRMVPSAEACAFLVPDGNSKDLLLKTTAPKGLPIVSLTLANRALSEGKGFIWIKGDNLTESQVAAKLQSGLYVPLYVEKEPAGVLCLDSRRAAPFTRGDLQTVTAVAHQASLAIAHQRLKRDLEQKNEVLERLLTNFSPQVRVQLVQRAQSGRLSLGGTSSVVSILATDIRGYTKLTRDMETEDIVEMLNDYFSALTDCVFRNGGTVDKFIGDAILAVFGSPQPDPQHSQNAVRAALDMQEAMGSVSELRARHRKKICQIGIGVHTGEVLHGFIGSCERMEYTVIGDVVNMTSRMCDGAAGGEILASPQIYQYVWRMIQAEQAVIKTKHEGDLNVYRIRQRV
jgi:class 3 adenylate cyclase